MVSFMEQNNLLDSSHLETKQDNTFKILSSAS